MSIESSRASRLSSSVAHQRCPVCNAQRCHTCPRAVPNGWLPAGECSRRRRGTIERTLLWCDSCGCRTTLLRLLWLGLVCNGPGACGLKLPDNAFHAAFFGSGRSGGLLTWLDYIACPLHVQLFIRGWWTLEVHGKYEEMGLSSWDDTKIPYVRSCCTKASSHMNKVLLHVGLTRWMSPGCWIP